MKYQTLPLLECAWVPHAAEANRTVAENHRALAPATLRDARRVIASPLAEVRAPFEQLTGSTVDPSTHYLPFVIENAAWLGAAVSMVPGVTIGRNAVVEANVVVTRDVPSNTVVGGIPAQVIRQST